MIGFSSPEGWPGFELAWALARRWWGHGYATEGAQAALSYAFTVLEKDRVISLIHPENARSIRVAERIGERPQRRIDHLGREMLCYEINRETYLKEVTRSTSGSDSRRTAQPTLKELLLADSPRAEIPVPSRQG